MYMEEIQKSYFYCYNPNLRRFLTKNGLKWIEKGINTNSGYHRWIFEQTEELSRLISEFKRTR